MKNAILGVNHQFLYPEAMVDAQAHTDTLKRAAQLSDSDVLSLRTSGEFTDAGYKMTTLATVLKDIGEERYFSEPQ